MSKRTRRRHSRSRRRPWSGSMWSKKPVSEICSAAQILPSVFYRWERDLLAAAPALFAGRRPPSREQELEAKIAALEAKLARKDAIIAEVSEEYVKPKKPLGSPDGRLGSHDTRDQVVDWIEVGERQAILDYFDGHPLGGYRRLTFMMLDEDIAAVSPATTYRVLAGAGRLHRWAAGRRRRGRASCSRCARMTTGTSTCRA